LGKKLKKMRNKKVQNKQTDCERKLERNAAVGGEHGSKRNIVNERKKTFLDVYRVTGWCEGGTKLFLANASLHAEQCAPGASTGSGAIGLAAGRTVVTTGRWSDKVHSAGHT
jgi:hypothetical protein